MRAGQPSSTAAHVAAHRLTMDRLDTGYGDPIADDRLTADIAGEVSAPPSGRMADYLTARTRFFDRAVVDALARGIRQVVVAGAGYDCRALRYGKPGVQWFEVDHPKTQMDKRARLERLGIATSSLHFVAADFRTDDVAQGLLRAGCDPTATTLLLCEGVAAYLDRSVLIGLLRSLRRAVAPDSQLAISVSVTDPSAEFAARREGFQARVAALGEPAVGVLEADEAEQVLADAGWRCFAGDGRLHRAGLLSSVAV